jgi:hypothetical protein
VNGSGILKLNDSHSRTEVERDEVLELPLPNIILIMIIIQLQDSKICKVFGGEGLNKTNLCE